MKVNKFFELAKERGIEASEVVIRKSTSLDMNVYHGEVESYGVADSRTIYARGIYNGKMGFASSEKDGKETPEYLVNQIILSSQFSESDDIAIIFEGSKKYKRRNMFNKKIAELSEKVKLNNLFEIEKKLRAYDPRITEVEASSYSEQESSLELYNSHGLKLKDHSNYFYYYASAVVKEGEEVKTGYKIVLLNDPDEVDLDKIVKEIAEDALSKLGGKPCDSGKYKTLIDRKVTADLLAAYLSSASAEEVQKKSSLFIDKLGQKVASSKVTVLDAPLNKNVFYSFFDGEGVAKFNKSVIEKGVLKTYFHNLSTAKKAGVEPTANGSNSGGKIGVSISNIVLKPGRKSVEDIIKDIKVGFYLTEVQGLHSGLNPTSGDFSLQASGFMIRDGKFAEPVNLVTIAGNLQKLFLDVQEVANDSQLQLSSYTTSSILVKKLAVSGN
jgi:PmbA protein